MTDFENSYNLLTNFQLPTNIEIFLRYIAAEILEILEKLLDDKLIEKILII